MPIYLLHGVKPTLPAEGRYWVAPDANIIGDIRLGEDASVWFGAVLRGDNEPIVIGARSNIQDLCALHSDMGSPLTIGQDCTVGHNVTLHGCTIGDGSLIGMGAVVLNGAKIGRGCLIGARALITEGKSFPDHSVIVGAPGKAVRTLDAEGLTALRASASHYVEKWRRFASGLRPLDDEP
jgi:carbonic anhydrase/acetyltransferase-like protein (isoleucine patch superfamily)